MRNISELFEFLSHCDKEILFTELNIHCDRLLKNNGTKSTLQFKFDVENLNSRFRLSEWYLSVELPKMIEKKFPSNESNEILTVEGAALFINYGVIAEMKTLALLIIMLISLESSNPSPFASLSI